MRRAFLTLLLVGWTTIGLAEQNSSIKFPSPDGRFALRITRPKDDEYHPTVELIEKDSGKVMVTLHSASDTELFDPSESVLVCRRTQSRWPMVFVTVRRASGKSRAGRLSVFGTALVSIKCFCRRTCLCRRSSFPREKAGT